MVSYIKYVKWYYYEQEDYSRWLDFNNEYLIIKYS